MIVQHREGFEPGEGAMPHARTLPMWVGHGAVLTIAWGTMILGGPPAGANPVPPSALYVHAQPEDPDHCAPASVGSCEDLQQQISDMGYVEFIVYLQRGDADPEPISSLDFTLEWGYQWYPIRVESCTNAIFTYQADYLDVDLHFEWPDCPSFPAFQPICKLVCWVGDEGCLQMTGTPVIGWGCPPQAWEEYPVAASAEAGVTCDYSCVLSCGYYNPSCRTYLSQSLSSFVLPQGEMGQDLLQAELHDYHSWCTVDFDATAPWITLDVTQTSQTTYDILMTVDTAGLAVGQHEAWVRATSVNRDCCHVYVTVTEPSQSIPDGESPPADEAKPTTWGGVKDLFRARAGR